MTMVPGAAATIAELIAASLEEAGFVRNGLSWYRYGAESIEMINIQPAATQPGPYLNLGVYYYRYGQIDAPTMTDCHVDTALNMVLTTPQAFREMELLNPTNDIPSEIRRTELMDLIRRYGIPWLAAMARFEAARALLADNPEIAHVSARARADLQPPRK